MRTAAIVFGFVAIGLIAPPSHAQDIIGQPQTGAQNQPQTPALAGNGTAVSLCLIKGSISSKGERIYHVPGGLYYDATVIDTSKGERWFCTEAEAVAAGWRKSKL